MSIQKLGPGRYRAQVYANGRNVSVGKVLGGSSVFPSKAKAVQARAMARERLRTAVTRGPTVAEWAERWWTDPLFAPPKESTALWRREVTHAFVDQHGSMLLRDVDDDVVGAWLAGGNRAWTAPGLAKMFADAASRKAGRLIASNPWRDLGLQKSTGNKHKPPPPEELVWSMIRHARRLTAPSFAAWLQFAAFTGMRPGEIDALRPDAIDFEKGRVWVGEQFNPKVRAFTLPKNGQTREAILTPPAREALLALPREKFVFTTLRGTHYTPSSRHASWNKVRSAAGYADTLYLATRHFAGWYMVNVLELPSEDVAIALGHTDGGELVRTLYGHREKDRALARVQAAYESVGNVTPLRVIEGEGL